MKEYKIYNEYNNLSSFLINVTTSGSFSEDEIKQSVKMMSKNGNIKAEYMLLKENYFLHLDTLDTISLNNFLLEDNDYDINISNIIKEIIKAIYNLCCNMKNKETIILDLDFIFVNKTDLSVNLLYILVDEQQDINKSFYFFMRELFNEIYFPKNKKIIEEKNAILKKYNDSYGDIKLFYQSLVDENFEKTNLKQINENENPTVFLFSESKSDKLIDISIYKGSLQETLIIDKFPIIFGRNMKIKDILIDDSSMSREHFQLDIKDNKLVLIDLNSSNGVRLNDEEIFANKEIEVSMGDIIFAGQTRIVINRIY